VSAAMLRFHLTDLLPLLSNRSKGFITMAVMEALRLNGVQNLFCTPKNVKQLMHDHLLERGNPARQ